MSRKTLSILLPAFALALSLALPARAEMSPAVYRAMQDAAPIHVVIVPTAVEVKLHDMYNANRVTVTAKVVKSIRSSLKAGDEIKFNYDSLIQKENVAGPAPIPILEKNVEVNAFLEKSEGGLYSPAAKGRSFSPLIDLNAGALEKLTIEIRTVKQTPATGDEIKIEATARVAKVEKSATDLKEDAIITLYFTATTKPTPASPLPPVPAEKQTFAASLYRQTDNKTYSLIADKWSFEPIK